MKYEKDYVLQWTYKENAEDHAYTNIKHFDTESERNKFALDVFTQAKQNKIVLLYAEERDIRKWEKSCTKRLDK